jgi:predicted  nucleic acid-binding Zn-ribbon protein
MLLIDASDELRKLRKGIAQLTDVVINLKETLMATQSDAAKALNSLSDKLDKIAGETKGLLDEIKALKDAAGKEKELSPELEAAIDRTVGKAEAVDSLVADAQPVVQAAVEGAGAADTSTGTATSEGGPSPGASPLA